MNKRIIGILLLVFFYMTAPSQAQQQEKGLSLSLEDCIIKALENNLNVAIEVLNPDLAEISISSAKEKFLPQLSMDYNIRNTNQASYSWIEASGDISTERNAYSTQLSQLIPTGGNFSISLASSKYDSNQKFQTINPRFSSTLTFNFTQPLLKNFGTKISRKEIIVAQNNLNISEENFRTSLQQTIYSVEEGYWNLVYSREILKVRQQSLKLAQDLLEKNRRAVEVGTLAPIEILNAQATVATREADILDAEAQVKNNEDILKTRINLSAEGKSAGLAEIIPADTPEYKKKDMGLDEALSIAMQNRPDLKATLIDLKNKEIDLSYTKNQLLPDLSFQASYWSPGVSGTYIIYPPENPFGDPTAIIPGGASDSLKDAFGFKYKNWSVGLTLSIPLESIFSRASYAQARVNLEQAKLRMKNQEQQIFLEIKTAVRAVQTNYKRVQAYKLARELSKKKLEAEEEKLKVGLTTNYFVLQYQTDLATSQSQELKAMIDYNLSLAQLSQKIGMSLKERNISISGLLGK